MGSPVTSKHSYLLTGAHESFLPKYALSLDPSLEWIGLFLFKNSLLWLKNQIYLNLLTFILKTVFIYPLHVSQILSLRCYCRSTNSLSSFNANSLHPGEGRVFTEEINNYSLLFFLS